MSKLLKICMVVAAVLSFTGCYNDFDDPAPAKVWTEADFNKDQIITIKQLIYIMPNTLRDQLPDLANM